MLEHYQQGNGYSATSWPFCMNASFNPESIEVNAAFTKVETEMSEVDVARRPAYARLNALIGQSR